MNKSNHIQKKILKSFFPYTLLFFITLLTQNVYLNIETIEWDIASYLIATQDIKSGFLPNQTQWESKGPLLFYIYYFILTFTGKSFVLFKIINDILLYSISLILFFIIYRESKNNIYKSFFGTLFFSLSMSQPWAISEYSEVYSLFFISLAYLVLLKGRNTKSIFLIDPINPLGSTYPKEEKKAICDLAEDHKFWIIDDITYCDFAPNHVLAADILPERTITGYSVSKNCGLAGLRVGSLVGPKEFISEVRGTMVSDLGINVVGQRAAIAALETKKDWLPGMLETARKNQEIIKKAVDKVEGASLPVYPSAASMMVIDISKHKADPQSVQDKLLYENDIFVRAGNYVSTRFGEKFIRVSFSIPTPEVEKFAEAFPKVMEELNI